MSISSVRESHRAGFGVATVWRTLLRGILAWESWLSRRQGWQDLKALDDHLLEDIGLSRADTLSLGHIWGNWSHVGDIGKRAIM